MTARREDAPDARKGCPVHLRLPGVERREVYRLRRARRFGGGRAIAQHEAGRLEREDERRCALQRVEAENGARLAGENGGFDVVRFTFCVLRLVQRFSGSAVLRFYSLTRVSRFPA